MSGSKVPLEPGPTANDKMATVESLRNADLLHEAKRLCSVCEAADIISDPANGDSESVSLRPLFEAQETHDCPLCAFLVDFLEKHWEGDLDGDFNFGVEKSLKMVQFYLRPPRPPEYRICLGGFNMIVCRGQDTRKGRVRKQGHPTIDIDVVKEWMDQCRNCHDHCRQVLSDTLAQQLLSLVNVGNLQLIDVRSLEIHTVSPGKLPPYVALSYVWTSRPPTETGSPQAAEDASHTHLRFHTLPRTLKESILLARDLKFPYIWIDRVCIDQKNQAAKKQIIPAMGAVYAGADLVIIAAAGNDIDTGLPGLVGNPRVKKRPLFRASTGSGHCIEAVEYETVDARIVHTFWSTRGWMFQEYLFARRALFVLADEMFMVCNQEVQEEMFSSSSCSYNALVAPSEQRLVDIKKAIASSRPLSWRDYSVIVAEFTRRDLTYEEDRLEALAGVLSQIDARCDEMTLKTGLPMSHFGKALTWEASVREFRGGWPSSLVSRALVNMAPSWSWASAGRPVEYVVYNRDILSEVKELLFTYKVSNVRNNIIGQPLQAPLGKFWRESVRVYWRDLLMEPEEGWRTYWKTCLRRICRKVWRNICWRVSSKSRQATDLTTIDALVRSISPEPERIPVIHLVTVIFYAYINLYRTETDSVDYECYKFKALAGRKHVSPTTLAVDTSRFGLLDVAKPWLFALVGAENTRNDVNLYEGDYLQAWVMMLREAGDGYYERVSICLIEVANELFELLEADESKAAWAYIKLR